MKSFLRVPPGMDARRAALQMLAVGFALLWGQNAFASSIIFSENFSGTSLSASWNLLPGQGSYVVNNGLTYAGQGPASSPSGWSTTSMELTTSFTGLYWEADVKTSYDLSWLMSGNYSGPSNPNQQNSSGAQQFWVAVSFDPVTAADRTALAGSNYASYVRGIDAWYGADYLTTAYGGISATGLLKPADSSIANNIAGGTYWLQFIRSLGTLTMNYSTDGVTYATALQTTLANPANAFNELILTGETYQSAGSRTEVSAVRITDITPIPEPGALLLTAFGLLAVVGLSHQERRRGPSRPSGNDDRSQLEEGEVPREADRQPFRI